jgi:hypothetical protein
MTIFEQLTFNFFSIGVFRLAVFFCIFAAVKSVEVTNDGLACLSSVGTEEPTKVEPIILRLVELSTSSIYISKEIFVR